MGDRGPTNLELHRQLGLARALLEAGQLSSVRERVAAVLHEPEAQADGPLKAQALLLLARHDCEVGRCRRALQTAQAAIHIFQDSGDIASEAAATSLLARAYSCIGHDEAAVEAGLLSTRLAALLPSAAQRAALFHELGVAYLWGQGYGAAESALCEAERLAALYGGADDTVAPRVHQAWLELLRLFRERYASGLLHDTSRLGERLQHCSDIASARTALDGGSAPAAAWQASVRCAGAIHLAWTGSAAAAAAQLAAARANAAALADGHLLHSMLRWAQCELHWASGELDAAQREASALIEAASQAEHEQLAQVGHQLLVQLHQQRGRLDLALDEERQLRRREQRIRAEGLEGRGPAVQAQLDLRASRHHLQLLAQRSQELERLSYEDPLTAIANRRCFEQRLTALLEQGAAEAAPFCLALVDLDDFKLVNDTWSHSAGDQVLKDVAQAIRGAVREADLPARFGGDEFVVVFPHTTLDTAAQVCQRVRSTLAALRWPQLSPALRISASIGVAQAGPGDTAQRLLQRSDLHMFTSKARDGVVAA